MSKTKLQFEKILRAILFIESIIASGCCFFDIRFILDGIVENLLSGDVFRKEIVD